MSPETYLKRSLCGAVGWALCSVAMADSCAQRTAAAMTALQAEVVGQLSAEDAQRARLIVQSVCDSETASADRVLRTTPAPQPSATNTDQAAQPVTIFGVEVRKAPRDSKGNERLRRKH